MATQNHDAVAIVGMGEIVANYSEAYGIIVPTHVS